jgi:hypothetical protein
MAKCHQNRNRRRRNARREKTRKAEGIHRRKQLIYVNWNSVIILNYYTEPFGQVEMS